MIQLVEMQSISVKKSNLWVLLVSHTHQRSEFDLYGGDGGSVPMR